MTTPADEGQAEVRETPPGGCEPGPGASVAARYFDGASSRANPVWLTVRGGVALVADRAGAPLRQAPLATLRVSERTRHTPRLVTFEDGAYCEIDDGAAFEAVLAATGFREGAVARAQNSWRLAGAALAAFAVFLALAYWVLLPAAASAVASSVPAAVESRLGDAALRALDDGMLAPSALPEAQQRRIRMAFEAMRLPDDPAHEYRILFRKGGDLGANAFALPGGAIVVTDELVTLAGESAGLMGVLAHEAGHVALRHGLQQGLQASAVATVFAYLLGDVSSMLATVPATVLTMRYSRDHEREADAYAVEVMRRNGLRPAALADMLEALEAARQGGDGKGREGKGGEGKASGPGRNGTGANDGGKADRSFFSTHPLTRDRVEALRNAR